MNKIYKTIIIIFALIFSLSINCYADNKKYDELLFENMDADIKEYLYNFGIEEKDIYDIFNDSPVIVFQKIIKNIICGKKYLLKSFLSIVVSIIITAIADSFLNSNDKRSSIIYFICSLSIVTTIIVPISNIISNAASCIKLSTVFINTYLPVMTSIILGSKKPSLAFTYNTFTLFISSVISNILNKYFVPICSCLLAFTFFKSLSNEIENTRIFNTIKKIVGIVMALFSSIYSFLLTTQCIFATSKDSLIMKGIKFATGVFVPVVGSGVGDALSSFFSSIHILKNSVGVLIIVIIILIFLPVTSELLLWYFALQICSIIASLFNLNHIDEVLENISSVISLINIILFFVGFILVISTGIIIMIGK